MKKGNKKDKMAALDKMRKMKKVTVMSDSEKGLKEGLSKAKEVLGSEYMDGGYRKMKDPSPAMASKYMDGGYKKDSMDYMDGGYKKDYMDDDYAKKSMGDKYMDGGRKDSKKKEKSSMMESLFSNPNRKKMKEGSVEKTGKKSLAERINFGKKYSNGGYNDA